MSTSSLPRRNAALLVALGLSLASPALAQSSARNVFWSASDLVQVAANPASKPAAEHAAASAPRRPATAAAHSRPHVEPELIAKNGYGEQPQLVRVSQEQIGMRYALLLRDSEGHYNEVSPKAIFHSGDRLRLSVMANQPGYLYVIQQGSSGAWTSIYPKPSNDNSSPANKIEAGQVYQIPGGKGMFRFDQTPGEEKLFLILSHERIADLEGAIDSLKKNGEPTSTPAPAATPAASGELIEASNHIPDAFVQQLASRDLTLEDEETVDQPKGAQTNGSSTPPSDSDAGAPSGEKAVYVVARASYTKGEAPRVVASVTLKHE